MTKMYAWELPFLFVVAGLEVLIVGYGFVRRFPVPTLVVCALLLLAMGIWYRAVRRSDDETAHSTAHGLVLGMVLLALVIPFLLRRLLGI